MKEGLPALTQIRRRSDRQLNLGGKQMAGHSHVCDKIAPYQNHSWWFGFHISFFLQSTSHTSLSKIASNSGLPFHLGFQHSVSWVSRYSLQRFIAEKKNGIEKKTLRPKSFLNFKSKTWMKNILHPRNQEGCDLGLCQYLKGSGWSHSKQDCPHLSVSIHEFCFFTIPRPLWA